VPSSFSQLVHWCRYIADPLTLGLFVSHARCSHCFDMVLSSRCWKFEGLHLRWSQKVSPSFMFLWIVPESVSPIFDHLIDGGWPSTVWRLIWIFSLTKAFFFRYVCAEKITRHMQCGCVWASLRAVCHLGNVVGLLCLNMFFAPWVGDVVLNFCLIVFWTKMCHPWLRLFEWWRLTFGSVTNYP
jgi:hypothetical protein